MRNSRSVTRSVGILLALGVLTPLLSQGPRIDTVHPSEGTIGERLTILGEGFGKKKPQVLLRRGGDGGGRGRETKRKLKVISSSDTEIVAVVKKATVGYYDVTVLPKSKVRPEITVEDAFEVRPPELFLEDESIQSLCASPGEQITVPGSYLGSKGLKVSVGGKKAKVVDVAEREISFIVPKKLRPGVYEVEVSNKIGRGPTAELTVCGPVVDPPVGGDNRITGTFDGDPFTINMNRTWQIRSSRAFRSGQGGVVVLATTGTKPPIEVVELLIPFHPPTDAAPLSFTGPAAEDHGVAILFAWFTRRSRCGWVVNYDDPGWNITVESFDGERIRGSFSGVLLPAEGDMTRDCDRTPKRISARFSFRVR